ncbi:PKD domain-containing protein [Patescibacteria group bacterium]|nr:PKD domain-containing protein [Patescibacteria group bacterium]
MKKKMQILIFISFVLIFFSCQDYEFINDGEKVMSTDIKLKSQNNVFASVDTAYIASDMRVIMKAVTINGDPSQWEWNLGDGKNVYGQEVDYIYSGPGTYNVIVTATDGSNCTQDEIVIIVESKASTVFSLHSSSEPNHQGKIKYIVSGAKEYVPDPPVSENGSFGYQGSNPESSWDVIRISPDTSSTRVYFEIVTYNEVYSLAYGGFRDDDEDDFIWAIMNESRFFSEEENRLRVGFLNGRLVDRYDYYYEVPGYLGDTGSKPEIRFEVNESENQMYVYINILDYTVGEINSPKVRFKINEEDDWSSQQDTKWFGGSGYIKYTTSINETGVYRLRVEPDRYNKGVYTKMNESDFYNSDENCFVWESDDVL